MTCTRSQNAKEVNGEDTARPPYQPLRHPQGFRRLGGEPFAKPYLEIKPPNKKAKDPISQILLVQNQVLELVDQLKTFTGTENDPKYKYLQDKLSKSIWPLDTIECGDDQKKLDARKQMIMAIQQCIHVLENRAQVGEESPDEGPSHANYDVEMKDVENSAETSSAQDYKHKIE